MHSRGRDYVATLCSIQFAKASLDSQLRAVLFWQSRSGKAGSGGQLSVAILADQLWLHRDEPGWKPRTGYESENHSATFEDRYEMPRALIVRQSRLFEDDLESRRDSAVTA